MLCEQIFLLSDGGWGLISAKYTCRGERTNLRVGCLFHSLEQVFSCFCCCAGYVRVNGFQAFVARSAGIIDVNHCIQLSVCIPRIKLSLLCLDS